MARVRALPLSLLVMFLTMFLLNCSPYSCRVTFGSSSCSPSGGGGFGGGGGGGNGGGGGGSTIDPANASTLVYYDSSLQGAGFGSTTFLPLTGYTPPSIPVSGAVEMTIVNSKFLYQPMGDSTIQGFSIDRTTGLLTAIPGSPFAAPGGATADGAWSDPAGKFLFVGSQGLPAIWAYTINQSTGALVLSPSSPFVSGFSSADIMTVDASSKFLYVGQGDPSAGVAAFSIAANGDISAVSGSPFSLGIAQLHASPTAEFLLGVPQIPSASGSANVTSIFVYSINPASGVPTLVPGAPFFTSSAPFDFAISPNSGFVYTFGTVVGVGTVGSIEGFSMNTTTGVLTSLGAPFSSLPTSSGCQFDQSGNDMFCIDVLFGTNMFVLGADSATGALTHEADLAVTPSNFPYAVTD